MSRTIANRHFLPYLHRRCLPEADLMDPVSMKEGRRPRIFGGCLTPIHRAAEQEIV